MKIAIALIACFSLQVFAIKNKVHTATKASKLCYHCYSTEKNWNTEYPNESWCVPSEDGVNITYKPNEKCSYKNGKEGVKAWCDMTERAKRCYYDLKSNLCINKCKHCCVGKMEFKTRCHKAEHFSSKGCDEIK